ncbi:MAG: penicillin-binding protein 1C [Gemmatimonadales bacterium]|nr:penicillin-binding protein 1C [Gemmatimonadales bacterium]
MSYRARVGTGPLRRARRAGLALGAALAVWLARPIDPALVAPPGDDGLVIRARDGAVLRATRTDAGSRQRWHPLASLDPDLLVAFVAAEDRRFWDHPGIDPLAVARAVRQNLGGRRIVSGASTIPMQLARLLRGTPRTWGGKLEQLAWAVRLDLHLSKQDLLEQYLNRVPLGQGAVGVDAAARLYFGTSAADLSLGQAAALAGLAHAPSRDNPLVSLPAAARRRDLVLDRLARARTALAEDIARARAEPVLGGGAGSQFRAPHFTSWLLRRADSLRTASGARTSLDLPLQRALEAEVRHAVGQLRSYGAEQAAVVALANRTGEILAWVGSADFFGPESGQVDMVVSARQPGSTLKPFLYGLAFDRGWTPASVLADVATVYPTATGPYAPKNYDRRYRGPVRIREALGSSYNVPAVELASKLGVAPVLGVLHRAGFASLDRRPDHYGLGLALGNGEVTLLELANGYRALANGGVWRPVRWLAAEPGDPPAPGVPVVSAEAAAQVIDILADPTARMPGFGPFTPLEFPFRAAAKTGTSRHFTDNWAVATTAGFTVAVWVGNFNGRPLAGASGITGAGPLLQRAVLATAARFDPGSLPVPADLGLVPVEVCQVSGLRATPRCPSLTEWFRPTTIPPLDDWYQPDGLRLPTELIEWASRNTAGNAVASAGVMRSGGEDAPAGFRITSPRRGDRFRFVPGVDPAFATVGLRAAGNQTPVRWYVDDRPHRGSRWPLTLGVHRIKAVAGTASDEVVIEVMP